MFCIFLLNVKVSNFLLRFRKILALAKVVEQTQNSPNFVYFLDGNILLKRTLEKSIW